MIFTVLVPEYLVGKAFSDWLAAVNGVQIMADFMGQYSSNRDGIEWDMVHAYMANMGYFVIDFSDIPNSEGKHQR
jgi:hypothetical protein